MELQNNQMAEFLSGLVNFNSRAEQADAELASERKIFRAAYGKDEEQNAADAAACGKSLTQQVRKQSEAYRADLTALAKKTADDSRSVYEILAQCRTVLAQAAAAEDCVADAEFYRANREKSSPQTDLNTDLLLTGKFSFTELTERFNQAVFAHKKGAAAEAAALLYRSCRRAEELMREEISRQREKLANQPEALRTAFAALSSRDDAAVSAHAKKTVSAFADFSDTLIRTRRQQQQKRKELSAKLRREMPESLSKTAARFLAEFPPEEMRREYARVCNAEPDFEGYACCREMPRDVWLGTLSAVPVQGRLSTLTVKFLRRYYPFMMRGSRLIMPLPIPFSSAFNSIFRYSTPPARTLAVQDACTLGLRLFMSVPPGKLRMTFIDPLELGASFAMFGQLVDTDDRTSEVINGKIWSDPRDIEEKLRVMTNHISNVTQRCLQGKYNSIYEYNRVAEQNAEPYQVLMLMDYPAGLNEHSLKLLEQIVTSGPKCGVFTILYRSESQFQKVDEKLHPILANIEGDFTAYDYGERPDSITCSFVRGKKHTIYWEPASAPSEAERAAIIPVLKKGIKNADKVEIGIEKMHGAETTDTTINGIRIPIGVHGANEKQYLTLGTGGSHHALIAGVAGSGKSSLLHTIIMQTLRQYSPEEISIYLIDFKRGVEFKIYADYVLPAFRVVAIESEREFGYNILEALEREQKIRADLFKRAHVDKIEEYRTETGRPMPRILVIMDEFHELFTGDNDEFAKKSAVMLERIVRQGRAFGVHLILSSQSYSNIRGVDRSVYDQMAVRIVLKCSNADADLLLENGSSEVDQISIDDPGRAVYNSEAGNKEYNSHFRVAYIKPELHRGMLEEVSEKTAQYADAQHQTRILLSNIEDNRYSFFNRFLRGELTDSTQQGKLYLGEPLSIANDMEMRFTRSEFSNLLCIGSDTDKARSMFAFALLSLCAGYRAAKGSAPAKPFIHLYNCKPLHDSYFRDIPQIIAEKLPRYIHYIAADADSDAQQTLTSLYDIAQGNAAAPENGEYFFVFGYQRADTLKSEAKLSQGDDIDMMFNIGNAQSRATASPKDMFRSVIQNGAQRGIHTVLWQDSFTALEQDDKDLMSYFTMKNAFSMAPDEFSRFVGENDVSLMGENNAIYFNRARDNQKFRPYQMPDEAWVAEICEKLNL